MELSAGIYGFLDLSKKMDLNQFLRFSAFSRMPGYLAPESAFRSDLERSFELEIACRTSCFYSPEMTSDVWALASVFEERSSAVM
jgi:hypothetical protein